MEAERADSRCCAVFEEDAKNIPYAIKIFDKSLLKKIKINTMDGMSNMLVKTDSEIKLQGMFKHPNIAKSFIAFDDKEDQDGSIYLLM